MRRGSEAIDVLVLGGEWHGNEPRHPLTKTARYGLQLAGVIPSFPENQQGKRLSLKALPLHNSH